MASFGLLSARRTHEEAKSSWNHLHWHDTEASDKGRNVRRCGSGPDLVFYKEGDEPWLLINVCQNEREWDGKVLTRERKSKNKTVILRRISAHFLRMNFLRWREDERAKNVKGQLGMIEIKEYFFRFTQFTVL